MRYILSSTLPKTIRGRHGESYRVVVRSLPQRVSYLEKATSLRALRSVVDAGRNRSVLEQMLLCFRVSPQFGHGADTQAMQLQGLTGLVERGLLGLERVDVRPAPVAVDRVEPEVAGASQKNKKRGVRSKQQDFLIYVTPVVKAEYHIIPLTVPEKLSAEPPFPKCARAVRLQLSLTQNAASPTYRGGAELRMSGDGVVGCYADRSLDANLGKNVVFDGETLSSRDSLELWLVGLKPGKISVELALKKPMDRFVLDGPASLELQVLDLAMDLFHEDLRKIGKISVDPNPSSREKYLEQIRSIELPPQIPLKSAQKRRDGRIVHKQVDGAHARARLVLPRLEDASSHPFAPNYWIELHDASKTGALSVFTQAEDGAALPMPIKIRVPDLAKKEHEFWIQGDVASGKQADSALEVVLNREPGGLDHTLLRGVDIATFTVVQLDLVEVDGEEMNRRVPRWKEISGRMRDAYARHYINLLPGRKGRKLHVHAKLTPPIPGVQVHFGLAEDPGNRTEENWGIDMPKSWRWNRISRSYKYKDKANRRHYLHRKGKTDDSGVARQTLYSSRFGGDKYEIFAYLAHDPHLAKYALDDDSLAKRKPMRSRLPFQVWRAFWYQLSLPKGVFPPDPPKASIDAYERVKAEMRPGVGASTYSPEDAPPRTFYRRYQIEGGADDTLVSVVGSHNWPEFKKRTRYSADEPVKNHIVVCENQIDVETRRVAKGKKTISQMPRNNQVQFELNKPTLDPPLQGGDMVLSATWQRLGGPSSPLHQIPNTLVSIPKPRLSERTIAVTLPADCPKPTKAHPIRIVVRCLTYKGPYLGSSLEDQTLVVFQPWDLEDYCDTITHELGHFFGQTPLPGEQPATLPPHPNAFSGLGVHCNFGNEQCVMFESKTSNVAIHRFCDVCHPYLLAQDMRGS